MSAGAPEMRVRELFDDGFVTLAPDRTIEWCSPGFSRLTDRPPEQLIGQPILSAVAVQDHDLLLAHIGPVLDAAAPCGRARCHIERPDGSSRAVLVSAASDSTGVVHLAMTDVTGTPEADRLSSVAGLYLQRSYDVVGLCDPRGIVRYINDAAQDILGRSPAEIIGSRAGSDLSPEVRADLGPKVMALSEGEEIRRLIPIETPQLGELTLDARIWRVPETGELLHVFRDATEEERRRTDLERTRRFFDSSTDCFVVLDDDGVVLDCNRSYAQMLGAGTEELIGTRIHEWVEVEVDVEEIRRTVREHGHSSQEVWETHFRTGRRRRMQWEASYDPESHSEFLIGRDVTEPFEQVAALRTADRFFDMAFELLVVLDHDEQIVKINRAFCEFLGHSEDDLRGATLKRFIHPDDLARVHPTTSTHSRRMTRTALEGHLRYLDSDGEWRILHTRSAYDPVHRDFHIVARDVTDQIRLGRELELRATVDQLTGLRNRSVLLDELASALSADRTFALLLLDLDDFKVVNDSLGHLAGDELLTAVAGRLQTAVRQDDVVARLGGDEFAVLAPDMATWEEATELAERITARLSAPFSVVNQVLHMSCSLGVTLSRPGRSPDDLLSEADTAAYRAKELGKHRYELFDDALRLRAAERLRMEADLRRALGRNEIEIVLQPIVEIDGGGISGVEALVRWRHPERGLLAPGAFIELAEATGLIISIGRRVLDLALEARSEILEVGRDVSVNVNVAAEQLVDPGFVEDVRRALVATDTPAHRLCIEVTESTLMENIEWSIGVLRQLRALGVQVAVDDFGTGYSSLSYLRQLPLDSVKIDRSFVAEVESDPTTRDIIRAVSDLADTLSLAAVVEGVETEVQRDVLADLGCRLAQGFFFHRPMPLADLRALVAGTQAAVVESG